MTLAEFEAGAFARALLDPTAPPPCGLPARRFAVYRNNVVVGLIDALAERFPVCRRLVGEEFFGAMAAVFVRAAPPRSKILHEYGEGFAQFVESFEPARDLPYLADVARLEYALGLAYHAADAVAVPPATFAATPPEDLERSALRLHPSLEFVASCYPVVSIWRTNTADADPRVIALDRAETAVVIRNGLDVEVHEAPRGGLAFLRALAQGTSLAQAIARGLAASPHFDLSACLRLLLVTRAIVAIEPPHSPRKENRHGIP